MKRIKISSAATLTGAYLAFLTGSGTATGQETLQYYISHGYQLIGTAIVFALILMVANFGFAYAGQKGQIKKKSDVFAYYCGPTAGKLFDIFSVFFCYMSFVVMVSGASATLNQQYRLPVVIGAIIMAALACSTVILGLHKIVDVIGRIGPVLLALICVIAFISLFRNWQMISNNMEAIDSGALRLTKAGENWFLSGVSEGGFCILWLAEYSASLGMTEDFKKLQIANIISSIVIAVIIAINGFALLGTADVVGKLQIPNLYLATEIWPPLAYIFGVIILMAIYTSACPLLWTASSRFAKEGTKKFQLLTITLAAIGIVIALYIPFNIVMNYVYVVNGYLGFIILVVMVVKMIGVMRRERIS